MSGGIPTLSWSAVQRRQELLRVGRLDEVTVETRLPGPADVLFLTVAGDGDQVDRGGGGVAAQRLSDRVAVHLRQPDVAEEDLRLHLLRGLDARRPRASDGDLVPVRFEEHPHAFRRVA